jgi:hypothetical protein
VRRKRAEVLVFQIFSHQGGGFRRFDRQESTLVLAGIGRARFGNGIASPPTFDFSSRTKIAVAPQVVVMHFLEEAHKEGLVTNVSTDQVEQRIRAKVWTPRYLPYRRAAGAAP